MNHRFKRILASSAVWTSSVGFSGCAGFSSPSARTPDVQVQAAERKTEIAQEFEQKRDQAQYQAALARFKQNDTEGCREVLEQLLVRSPDHYEARLLQVELMLLSGELEDAQHLLETLLTERPQDAAAHHAAGLLLEAQGDLPQAVPHYEQAVQGAPDNSAYRATLQLAQDALTDLKTGGARGITRVSANSLEENAADAASLRSRRKANETSDDIAAATDGNDPESIIASATGLVQSNQPAKARNLLETAKSRFPSSAPVYRSLGLACYRSGDYQAAYDALQTALSLDSTNGLSYFLMGCTLSKLGERQAAESHFSKAAALDPRFASATASAP